MELMNTRMFHWKKGRVSGIASEADVILLSEAQTIYNKPLKEAKTIFIHTRLGDKLIKNFINDYLNELKQPVNIIIAGDDYIFPGRLGRARLHTLIRNPMINKMFIENS